MTIEWRAQDRQFHLRNEHLSLVLRVYEDGSLGQLHLGSALPLDRPYRHLGPDPFDGHSNRVGDPVPLAYPTAGTGDYRVPALVATGPDGATALALRYRAHRVTPGKPALEGLPSTYVEADSEAETLAVTTVDEPSGLEADLRFTIFADRPVIARSATFRATTRPVELRTAMSLSVDLPDADWVALGLSGAWAREAHVVERALAPGRLSISSQRGSSGHEHNPFLALRRPTADEARGEVLGFSLAYSGNFLAEIEVDPFATVRVRLGIEPETFTWSLEPGAAFTTPEAIVVHTTGGLGAMSDAFHGLFRERLARGRWRDAPRPVLLNSWEGAYFDFDAEHLVAMAASARELGVELFVLDDGWFGRRDADTTSLGDWVVDRRKLPDGLAAVAHRIVDLDMAFGLWIEPEMVSPESDLFRAHPEWAIGIPGRPSTEQRHQLVLDLSRPDVVDHLADAIGAVLADSPISYVKWDMNRTITEPFGRSLPAGRQGEFFHRYILGTYELYRRLIDRFPGILFESCASGGGRFDPGLLAFAPQGWTSDDTDAVERLRIQWGTSLAYPLSAMGAHVAAVPNHQTGRLTPLATRGAVAFFGLYGLELDPLALTASERAEVAAQVDFYVRHRELFQRGRLVRIETPFGPGADRVSWMVVAPDGSQAVLGIHQVLNRPTPANRRVRLRGLDPSAAYAVTAWPDPDDAIVARCVGQRSGAELMTAGLPIDIERHVAAGLGDFWSRILVLDRLPG
jgi:alpha-galactosidase